MLRVGQGAMEMEEGRDLMRILVLVLVAVRVVVTATRSLIRAMPSSRWVSCCPNFFRFSKQIVEEMPFEIMTSTPPTPATTARTTRLPSGPHPRSTPNPPLSPPRRPPCFVLLPPVTVAEAMLPPTPPTTITRVVDPIRENCRWNPWKPITPPTTTTITTLETTYSRPPPPTAIPSIPSTSTQTSTRTIVTPPSIVTPTPPVTTPNLTPYGDTP
mmetsp:Transcript_30620/g.60980  ORF Transcript_30620/g.60980 Transcript_30620/m.60980 type:complete len:214 (+) Transcript_30620:30-671(+)